MSKYVDLSALRLEMIQEARERKDKRSEAELFNLTVDQFELWHRLVVIGE